jgi:hypothetical protein
VPRSTEQVLGAEVDPLVSTSIPRKRGKPAPPPTVLAKRREKRGPVGAKKRKDTCDDFALTTPILIRKRFSLGDRYSLQIEEVTVKGGEGKGKKTSFKYEAIVITRDGVESEDPAKAVKPFKFNIPSKLLIPLKNVLCHIADQVDYSNVRG